MLDEEIWEDVSEHFAQSNHQMMLSYQNLNIMSHSIMLRIDYYRKSDMANLSVPDFDSFISFYKTLGPVMYMYEHEYGTVHDLLALESRYTRGSSARSGKRQHIVLSGPEYDSVTEYIFLETDDYYFAVAYEIVTKYFNTAQRIIINDVVRNLRIISE